MGASQRDSAQSQDCSRAPLSITVDAGAAASTWATPTHSNDQSPAVFFHLHAAATGDGSGSSGSNSSGSTAADGKSAHIEAADIGGSAPDIFAWLKGNIIPTATAAAAEASAAGVAQAVTTADAPLPLAAAATAAPTAAHSSCEAEWRDSQHRADSDSCFLESESNEALFQFLVSS
ncbi:hypothetical protein JKP88DRAFT_350385 [Tribonema minus]|uniref:Uncharacterized protein n=1 Tax=Tribonema minus TaxID=303371 RepID=A0A836C9R9_9STRA|nr:hypothetical protein JKP88DRAFT_350385 [Tribonema minus]